MKSTISKTKKGRDPLASKPEEVKKAVTEQDIRNRAFEIYLNDKKSTSTAQDNWFYAERELNGYYK